MSRNIVRFFLFFFRNRIQCIALYQLHNSQALLNLRRGYFRTYWIQKSKERRARRVELEKKLTDLEGLLRINSTENIREEYDICRTELDQLYDYITAGIVMRSESSWYEHGEKSSKYFLNLEKCNKAKSHVRSLISESGIQVNDPTEIMSKVRHFYSKLFTRRGTKTEKECLDY